MFCLKNCFFREVYRFAVRLGNKFFQVGTRIFFLGVQKMFWREISLSELSRLLLYLLLLYVRVYYRRYFSVLSLFLRNIMVTFCLKRKFILLLKVEF